MSDDFSTEVAQQVESKHIEGKKLVEQKLPQDALRVYDEAIAIAGNDPGLTAWIRFDKGKTLLSLGQFQDALTEFRHSQESLGDNTYVHTEIGNAQVGMKQLASAEQEFTVALHSNPENWEASQGLERIAQLRRNAEAFHVQGAQLLAQGDQEGARQAYLEAITLVGAENASWSVFDLGKTLESMGHHDEALAQLEQAKQLLPDSPWPNVEIGKIYIELNDFRKAELIYQQLETEHPENDIGSEGLARINKLREEADFFHKEGVQLRDSGDFQAALLQYEQAIQKVGEQETPWSVYDMGECLHRLGKTTDAILMFQRAQVLLPNSTWPYTKLGDAYLSARKYTEAYDAFDRALHIDPQNSEAEGKLKKLEQMQIKSLKIENIETTVRAIRDILRINWLDHNDTVEKIALPMRELVTDSDTFITLEALYLESDELQASLTDDLPQFQCGLRQKDYSGSQSYRWARKRQGEFLTNLVIGKTDVPEELAQAWMETPMQPVDLLNQLKIHPLHQEWINAQEGLLKDYKKIVGMEPDYYAFDYFRTLIAHGMPQQEIVQLLEAEKSLSEQTEMAIGIPLAYKVSGLRMNVELLHVGITGASYGRTDAESYFNARELLFQRKKWSQITEAICSDNEVYFITRLKQLPNLLKKTNTTSERYYEDSKSAVEYMCRNLLGRDYNPAKKDPIINPENTPYEILQSILHSQEYQRRIQAMDTVETLYRETIHTTPYLERLENYIDLYLRKGETKLKRAMKHEHEEYLQKQRDRETVSRWITNFDSNDREQIYPILPVTPPPILTTMRSRRRFPPFSRIFR